MHDIFDIFFRFAFAPSAGVSIVFGRPRSRTARARAPVVERDATRSRVSLGVRRGGVACAQRAARYRLPSKQKNKNEKTEGKKKRKTQNEHMQSLENGTRVINGVPVPRTHKRPRYTPVLRWEGGRRKRRVKMVYERTSPPAPPPVPACPYDNDTAEIILSCARLPVLEKIV